MTDMELRVEEAQNPVDLTPVAPLPTVDTTSQDSTAVAEDLAATDETTETEVLLLLHQ